MMPQSPFLNGLNGRRIPETIKVTTIAGTAEIDTAPRPPHDSDPGPVIACAHLTGRVQHPAGDPARLGRVPCRHPEVQHPGGHPTTVPCVHPPASRREEVGSDGLIRVTSVRLSRSEAANIAAQHVLRGVWHTAGIVDLARGGPNPKLFINGRDAPPWNALGSTPPIPGTAVRGPHFFNDDRVRDILLGIAQSN